MNVSLCWSFHPSLLQAEQTCYFSFPLFLVPPPSTHNVFILPKFKLLYRFPNKPYKLCLVKIRLGQQSKLGLLSIGKSNKEQSADQRGKCTVHANTARLLEKVLDEGVKAWQHQPFQGITAGWVTVAKELLPVACIYPQWLLPLCPRACLLTL